MPLLLLWGWVPCVTSVGQSVTVIGMYILFEGVWDKIYLEVERFFIIHVGYNCILLN
jgi:hypothetical protein